MVSLWLVYIYVLLLVLLIIMSVFFVLPIQSAVVKVFIFRSDVIVNCWSQRRILCGYICLTSFIIWSVYMYVSCWYCFHDYVLFIAFDFAITFQVASVQFLLFRWDSQLLESMLYIVRLRWSYITYYYIYILLLVLFQAVLPCGCVWCLVKILIDITGIAKFNFAVVQFINNVSVSDKTFLKCKFLIGH